MTLYASNGKEKSDEDRVRRNAPRIQETEILDDGEVRGPELPPCPDKVGWCSRTEEWYHTWRVSPNSKLFTPTDWEAMLECCIIHNRIWNPNLSVGDTNITNLMGELRRRVAVWGATHYDRVQLKLKITTPQSEDEKNQVAAKTTQVVNYAEELTKAAAKETAKEE